MTAQEDPREGGGGREGEFIRNLKRTGRFLTRWDQHTFHCRVAPALNRSAQETRTPGGGGGGGGEGGLLTRLRYRRTINPLPGGAGRKEEEEEKDAGEDEFI